MKKKLIICIICCFLLSGCGSKNEQAQDEKIESPETLEQVSNTSDETERDYGNKKVVDGFWVQENTTGGDKWYRYVPMLSKKMSGIYDFEDGEQNKSMDSYTAYNCPEGARASGIEASGTYSGFYTTPQLGFNANPKDEKSEELGVIKSTTSFAFGQNNSNQNKLSSYDVGCITFALYKELYDGFPDIKIQVYGVTEEQMMNELGELAAWSYSSYSAFTNKCKENNYEGFSLLGEKEITDSGIFYIDYQSLSKENSYMQYFIVLRFSESTECGYYMNGGCTYDIENAQAYEAWKQEHKEQFIAGK